MRRTTKIIVVVYLIRGNVSRQIIWHLVAIGSGAKLAGWKVHHLILFSLFVQNRSSDRRLSFDVECGILLMELYILFAQVPYF